MDAVWVFAGAAFFLGSCWMVSALNRLQGGDEP